MKILEASSLKLFGIVSGNIELALRLDNIRNS